MNTPNQNSQIAQLIKSIEASDEPIILTPGYMLELFDEIGFQRWLNMYGYVAELHKEPTSSGRAYYHISKNSNRLIEDVKDEEL